MKLGRGHGVEDAGMGIVREIILPRKSVVY